MAISGVKLKKSDILEAIAKNKGVLVYAAKTLGCHPDTIYDWKYRDPDVAKAIESARFRADIEFVDKNKVLKEKAYKSTLTLLEKSDVTMTIFVMKTLGRFQEAVADKTIVIERVEYPARVKGNDSV